MLNKIASLLFKDARKSLPEVLGKQREDLVAILLEKRYEEAEKMSSTFLYGNESSVAEKLNSRSNLKRLVAASY